VELVERQLGRFGVDGGLALRRALLRAWARKSVAQHDDLTQADTQGFD
jgi:hypothetical protein